MWPCCQCLCHGRLVVPEEAPQPWTSHQLPNSSAVWTSCWLRSSRWRAETRCSACRTFITTESQRSRERSTLSSSFLWPALKQRRGSAGADLGLLSVPSLTTGVVGPLLFKPRSQLHLSCRHREKGSKMFNLKRYIASFSGGRSPVRMDWVSDERRQNTVANARGFDGPDAGVEV
jgi:hypothetical protein